MTGGDARAVRAAADAPLVWNVAGLLGETSGAVRDYAVSGVKVDGGEDFTLAEPIEGRVHLGRTNRGLLVDADFSTTLATQCARCLRDISVPLAFEIHDEALPAIDFHSGRSEFDRHQGSAPRTSPGKQNFWVAQAEGSGEQALTWDAEFGRWTAVVMNADAARGIDVKADAGIKLA